MSRSGTSANGAAALLVAQVGRRAHPVDEPVAQVRRGLDHAAADEERGGSTTPASIVQSRPRPSACWPKMRSASGSPARRARAPAWPPGRPAARRGRARARAPASTAAGSARCRSARRRSPRRRAARRSRPAPAGPARARRRAAPARARPRRPCRPRRAPRPRRRRRPPPRPVPTTSRHRRARGGVGAEVLPVRVQRGRAGVVAVDDRQPEPLLQRAATSKPRQPSCSKLVEPREDSTPSALAGPGVPSPTARTSRAVHAGQRQHAVERLGHRRDGDLRPLADPARRLDEAVDEERPGRVHHGRVVGRAAVVEPDDDLGRGQHGRAPQAGRG